MDMDNLFADRSLNTMRQSARQATYPNTEAETKAVTDLENQIAGMVADHEQQLVNIAEATYGESTGALTAGDSLFTELGALQTDIERAGAHVGADLAKRYEGISKRLVITVARLRNVQARLEFQADKVADPYGSLDNLRQKYPAVIAGRRL